MASEYLSKISGILNDIQYATLATVSVDGEPYNAPVFMAYDEDLNLYWSSSVQAQHSQNIDSNSKVYIVVYDSTAEQGTGWGLYIRAEATAVMDTAEAKKALNLLGKRRGKPFRKNARDMIEGAHRIYKAKPSSVWINDAKQDSNGEWVEDYREPIDINEVIKIIK